MLNHLRGCDLLCLLVKIRRGPVTTVELGLEPMAGLFRRDKPALL